METDVNELAAKPAGVPVSGSIVVMIVTPARKWPSTCRKAAPSISGNSEVTVVSLHDLPRKRQNPLGAFLAFVVDRVADQAWVCTPDVVGSVCEYGQTKVVSTGPTQEAPQQAGCPEG